MKPCRKLIKGVALLEVLVAATVVSLGIVSVFRAFTASIFATQLSQDITSASLLFKDKLWDLEKRSGDASGIPLNFQEKVLIRGKEFLTKYEIVDTESPDLKKITYTIFWKERSNVPYSVQFDASVPWKR